MKSIGIVVLALCVTACASSAKEIQAKYVSPTIYRSFDCEQLSLEADRISRRVSELTGQIDKRAAGDKKQMAVAIILFWPAAFFLGNNKEQNAELSRLKGESEALQQASIEKKCIVESVVASESKITENTPTDDVYTRLGKLSVLRDDGTITEEEFQVEKAKLLGNSTGPSTGSQTK